MVLTCLPGASLSKRALPGYPNGSFLPPWCLPAASQTVQLILGSFLPPWCLASCPMSPFLPSWCLSGCPNRPFQSVLGSRPWSPPQDVPRTGPFAIEIVLKVRQNPAPFQNRNSIGNPVLQVSLVPPRLSKWLFPASLVPPWCLASCPIDPFLPPWCLQAVQLILSCLPGASQAVQMVLSCLPGAFSGASLVPRKLAN